MKGLTDIPLKANEKEAILKAKQVLKAKFPVADVILFGSKARGDSDPESDIDLLVLTTRPIEWRERHLIIDTLFEIEIEYGVIISIIINTVQEWQDGIFSVLPIHEEISKEGILI